MSVDYRVDYSVVTRFLLQFNLLVGLSEIPDGEGLSSCQADKQVIDSRQWVSVELRILIDCGLKVSASANRLVTL